MVWPAVAAAGASVLGSAYSANQAAASQAAANEYNVAIEEARMKNLQGMTRAEAQAANEIAESRRQYGEAQLAPYTEAGESALSSQRALLGLSGEAERTRAAGQMMAGFERSPGHDFVRQEQERAILRNASATGGLRGGRTLEALRERAFQRAQSEYRDYESSYYNRLAGLSGAGLGARGQLASQYRGVSTTLPPEYQAIDKPSGPGGMTKEQKFVDRYADVGTRTVMKAFGGGGGK